MIHVTAQDISEGLPGNSQFCPVALAVNKAIHREKDVQVDGNAITIDDVDFTISETVRQFIADFDDGKPVKPFCFEIIYD